MPYRMDQRVLYMYVAKLRMYVHILHISILGIVGIIEFLVLSVNS